jgi:DNA-binding transcriptional MerR regulator
MFAEQHMQLSLEDLSTEVARLLETYGLVAAQRDLRVSAVPDARTIRYYTTLGLLDRPFMEGRQARYGKRHIQQLLAIKALQGLSLPLSEIQARLYGRTDEELESLLSSLQQQRTESVIPTVRPVVWQEVVIEPGLKLMVEDGWSAQNDINTIEAKIRAVLAALQRSPNPGKRGSIE